MDRSPVDAMSLLARSYFDMLGPGLQRAIPVCEDGRFDDLLGRLEQAERRRRK